MSDLVCYRNEFPEIKLFVLCYNQIHKCDNLKSEARVPFVDALLLDPVVILHVVVDLCEAVENVTIMNGTGNLCNNCTITVVHQLNIEIWKYILNCKLLFYGEKEIKVLLLFFYIVDSFRPESD